MDLPSSPWGLASSPSLPTRLSSHWERLVLASTLPLHPYLKLSGLLQAASLPRGASLSPLALCPVPGISTLAAGSWETSPVCFPFSSVCGYVRFPSLITLYGVYRPACMNCSQLGT